VALFRRREPLHERLAREGGLGVEPPPLDPRPPTLETGIHGVQRPREWDMTALAEADGIEGDEAAFVALPDGSLLVERGSDSSLAPLAEAVERELSPPYRAHAVRRGDALWAVEARRIEVLELRGAPDGDTLDLTRTAEGSELRVDGERAFGTVRGLEERGEREGAEFALHAERLEGELWELRVSPL
jgi:hypothetical protein